MERWIIHYEAGYDAVPWPFTKTWDEFVRSPESLQFTCDDFGRAAPCDSLSETPSVPPRLPRLVPRGRYRMAVYHDAEWLYAFLEAENGPTIVPAKQLDAIPHLAGINHLYPVVVLLTPDQRFTYRFGLDGRGQPSSGIVNVVYGKRVAEPPKRTLRSDLHIIPTKTGELSCWRIARASIADAFLGNTVRFSMSRMHFETHEAVAWGSHTTWGPRPDEFGTVRLVEKRQFPAWPVARRIEMLYEPRTETAKFRVNWEGVYRPAETDVQVYPNKEAVVPWLQWSLRLNGEQRLFDFTETTETDEFAVGDNHNQLEIASVGGPAVRLDIEKWSGNRIVRPLKCGGLPPLSPATAQRQQAAALQSLVRDRIRRECDEAIQALEARRASGEKLSFKLWETYQAASFGRTYHYLHHDARLLDVVREQADFALTLQRADGSFGGLHLTRHGVKVTPWAGGAYDTGPAGELWVVAAWLLKDEKYLEASRRLLHAYKDYRIEFNYNYAAFALYHLVTHYRLTQDPLALEHALDYCQNCVAVDLLPLGFHAGHNYYTCYGSITLRGMAQLCAVLPASDPYRATLRELCIRMTNQVLSRQQPDGTFEGRDRFFLTQRYWSWGLFSVAFLLPPEDVARLDVAIQRMLNYPGEWRGFGGGGHRLAENDFVRYWAHRDDLLAGKKINLLELI